MIVGIVASLKVTVRQGNCLYGTCSTSYKASYQLTRRLYCQLLLIVPTGLTGLDNASHRSTSEGSCISCFQIYQPWVFAGAVWRHIPGSFGHNAHVLGLEVHEAAKIPLSPTAAPSNTGLRVSHHTNSNGIQSARQTGIISSTPFTSSQLCRF